MPSKAMLLDEDKKAIRKRLRNLCEECWIKQGYKRTSVKILCDKTEISIGTFYTLYPSKEDLFLETIKEIQKRLSRKFLETIRNQQTKEGFAQAMKELIREYAGKPFLYNINTPDFQSFAVKLPEGTMQNIKFDSFTFFGQAVQTAKLTLKIEPSQAFGMLSALLATISAKETLSITCDFFIIYDCMTDIIISSIFE